MCATEETYVYKDHPFVISMRNYLMQSITSKCIEELDCMTAYNQYPIRVYITGPSWRESILTCVSMLRVGVLLSVVLIDSPDGYNYSPMSQFQISHVRNRTLTYLLGIWGCKDSIHLWYEIGKSRENLVTTYILRIPRQNNCRIKIFVMTIMLQNGLVLFSRYLDYAMACCIFGIKPLPEITCNWSEDLMWMRPRVSFL